MIACIERFHCPNVAASNSVEERFVAQLIPPICVCKTLHADLSPFFLLVIMYCSFRQNYSVALIPGSLPPCALGLLSLNTTKSAVRSPYLYDTKRARTCLLLSLLCREPVVASNGCHDRLSA